MKLIIFFGLFITLVGSLACGKTRHKLDETIHNQKKTATTKSSLNSDGKHMQAVVTPVESKAQTSFDSVQSPFWGGATTIWTILEFFDEAVPEELEASRILANKAQTVQAGKDLVTTGRASGAEFAGGDFPLSKKYRCTHCHNIKSDTIGIQSSPATRLALAAKDPTIYLTQGSSFKGIVNRESFYNGIWSAKKEYKGFFRSGNQSLPIAVDLCASTCSQGREISDREREAILAYFWSLQLSLKDLQLSVEAREILDQYRLAKIKADKDDKIVQSGINSSAVRFLKGNYPTSSPAVNGHPEFVKQMGGDIKRGQLVYQRACLQCHGKTSESPYSSFSTATTGSKPIEISIPHGPEALKLPLEAKTLVTTIRKGTNQDKEKGNTYMPFFTKERLSNAQITDLIAYIKSL